MLRMRTGFPIICFFSPSPQRITRCCAINLAAGQRGGQKPQECAASWGVHLLAMLLRVRVSVRASHQPQNNHLLTIYASGNHWAKDSSTCKTCNTNIHQMRLSIAKLRYNMSSDKRPSCLFVTSNSRNRIAQMTDNSSKTDTKVQIENEHLSSSGPIWDPGQPISSSSALALPDCPAFTR